VLDTEGCSGWLLIWQAQQLGGAEMGRTGRRAQGKGKGKGKGEGTGPKLV